MAKKDTSMKGKLRQEAISEDEADELREQGLGFQRKAAGEANAEPIKGDSGDEVERLAQGEWPSEDPRSYRTFDEHPSTPDATTSTPRRDDSIEAGLRAHGRFVSDSEPTQLEEDFGERGLHTAGGPFDHSNTPSILDPDEDD